MLGSLLRPMEPTDVEFRLRTLRTGVYPSIFACLYSGLYYALTWERPHRGVLMLVMVVALAATIAVAHLPAARLVRSRWGELFFIGWSVGLIGIIALSAGIDGGAGSPAAFLLVLPLIYATLSYPLSSILVVAVVDVVAYVVLALGFGDVGTDRWLIFAAVLVNAAWICAWQARNHEQQRRELARMSRSDALTGVLNRRGFEERLSAELSRARRDGSTLLLALFDLDDFKTVNDTGGHAAGDRLLRAVAAALAGAVRPTDAVARLGGDEFGVLLVGDVGADALARIRGALDQVAPASCGSAVFPGDGDDEATLQRVADVALYGEKRVAHRRGATPLESI